MKHAGMLDRSAGASRTDEAKFVHPTRIERDLLLVVTCTAAAAGEAAVLLAVGHRGLPLAAQVSAIPPLGLFHDLRWLVVSHRSWLGFSVGFAAVVALRAAATTGSVWLAWPRDDAYPGLVRAYL